MIDDSIGPYTDDSRHSSDDDYTAKSENLEFYSPKCYNLVHFLCTFEQKF